MRVLMINEVCGVTSTGRICTDIADILYQKGHECIIGYGRGSVPEKDLKYAHVIGNKFDVYIHALCSRLFDHAGFYSASATRQFLGFIDEYKPDIIHLHNIHGYYIHVGLLFQYLKSVKIPIVWTLHDCWPLTGHCTCSDFIGCEKWKTECNCCPQRVNYPSSLFLDKSERNYREKKETFSNVSNLCIVTPSAWLKRQVENSFLKDYETIVIPSGIDTTVFRPVKSEFRKKYHLEGKKILLAVANTWSDRKGIADYIKLAKDINSSCQLILVGDLRGIKVPENILCIEHTNNQTELAEIYTEADIFLNFSCEETQGLTTVEALACGTPVIVVNRTAILECVDVSCGIVLERYDKDEFMNALDNALRIKQENCIRQASRYKKRERFEDYVELYERLQK